MKSEIKKLAVSGLLGGALVLGGAGCGKSEEKKPAAGEKAPAPTTTATPKTEAPKTAPKTEAPKTVAAEAYSELHDCAGKNACKGLGGCKVTAEKLAELSAAAGVPADKAGAAHDCMGMNACKGMGGCSVDEAKLATLKEKLAQ